MQSSIDPTNYAIIDCMYDTDNAKVNLIDMINKSPEYENVTLDHSKLWHHGTCLGFSPSYDFTNCSFTSQPNK